MTTPFLILGGGGQSGTREKEKNIEVNDFCFYILLTALRSTAIPYFIFSTNSNFFSHKCVPCRTVVDSTSI